MLNKGDLGLVWGMCCVWRVINNAYKILKAWINILQVLIRCFKGIKVMYMEDVIDTLVL